MLDVMHDGPGDRGALTVSASPQQPHRIKTNGSLIRANSGPNVSLNDHSPRIWSGLEKSNTICEDLARKCRKDEDLMESPPISDLLLSECPEFKDYLTSDQPQVFQQQPQTSRDFNADVDELDEIIYGFAYSAGKKANDEAEEVLWKLIEAEADALERAERHEDEPLNAISEPVHIFKVGFRSF